MEGVAVAIIFLIFVLSIPVWFIIDSLIFQKNERTAESTDTEQCLKTPQKETLPIGSSKVAESNTMEETDEATASEPSSPIPADKHKLSSHPLPYAPNFISIKERIIHSTIAIFVLALGSYGVVTGHVFLPSNRGFLELYGYPAWIMCLAMFCYVACLVSVVFDHYDKRDNETFYKNFSKYMMRLTSCLFFAGLISGVVKRSQDYHCENSELSRCSSGDQSKDAVIFKRHCAQLNSFTDHSYSGIQISIVSKGSPVPSDPGNAVIIGKNNLIEEVYWGEEKLFVKYRSKFSCSGTSSKPNLRRLLTQICA